MKNKFFCLCLLAVLFLPFPCYCQEEVDIEDIDLSELFATEKDSASIVRDSLRNLAYEYYKDVANWDIFIEPAIYVEEDSVFDHAGLRHAYFVKRYYYFAVPHRADFRFQPHIIGPLLFAYGQKMPVEGKDPAHFQMIRSAVFPFAAGSSALESSQELFQKYADTGQNEDIQKILNTSIFSRIKDIQSYSLYDTDPGNGRLKVETYRPQVSVLSCLDQEFQKAKTPLHSIKETLGSPKYIAQLKKDAASVRDNVYLVPKYAILNTVVTVDDEESFDGPLLSPNVLADGSFCVIDDPDMPYQETFLCNALSGKTYYMLNANTVFVHPQMYMMEEGCPGCGARDAHNYYGKDDGEYDGEDTVFYVSPQGIEKVTPAECYNKCLKGENVSCYAGFPPVLRVSGKSWNDEDLYEYEEELYSKDIILQYVKEGSVLYDYFAKDFYRDNFKDVRGIAYDYTSEEGVPETEDVLVSLDENKSLTASQSKKIKKLLCKFINLVKKQNQIRFNEFTSEVGAHKRFSLEWDSFYDDYYLSCETIDFEKRREACSRKIEKLENKKMEVWKKIDRIAGHSISVDSSMSEILD